MVSFENFVKSLPPSLSELKVKPIFCFSIKICDDPTASNTEVDFGILNLKLVYLHICKENGANYFFRLLPHRMTAIHCLIIAHFITMLAASMRGRFLLVFLAGFSSNWAS